MKSSKGRAKWRRRGVGGRSSTTRGAKRGGAQLFAHRPAAGKMVRIGFELGAGRADPARAVKTGWSMSRPVMGSDGV